jgi:uncharacterized protein
MFSMKRVLWIKWAMLASLLIVPGWSQAAEPDPKLSTLAKSVVDQLSSGRFEEVTARFDSTMKAGLSLEKLKETWKMVTTQAGTFQHQTGIRTEKVQNYDVYFVTCAFEKTPLDVKIVFNSAQEIAGLFVLPVQAPPSTIKADAASSGLEGTWQGALDAGGQQLRLVLKISQDAKGTLSAKMDSVDQGAMDLPVSSIALKGSTLNFAMNSIGGSFEGTWDRQKQEISGQWKQGMASLPLILKRVDKPITLLRPQEPQKPYPYIEEEIRFDNPPASITLAGTLTYPKTGGPFPVVLLISGSGPQDRNETVFGHRPFLVMADYLTRQGFAVLRWDDRGIGGSTGSMATSTSEDFASDVLAAVGFLKNRKEIDPKKIGLLGHSEGGMVAPLAAIRSKEIAFVILMAGPGLTGEDLLFRQGELINRAMGTSEDIIVMNRQIQTAIFSALKEEPDNDKAEKKIRDNLSQIFAGLPEEQRAAQKQFETIVDSQIKMLLTPWFRYFISYDPKPALRQLTCPVLALNGEKDLQVPAQEDISAIESTLKASGHSNFKTVIFPHLNHLFQTCSTGSLAEYSQIEETIAPEALKLIADWLGTQTGLNPQKPG